MTTRTLRIAATFVLVFIVGVLFAQSSQGQGRGGRGAAPAGPPPRDAQGRPDLSGIWMTGGGGGRSDTPPYDAKALEKIAEFRQRLNIDDPDGFCLLPGIPRIYQMPMPFKIIQLPAEVVFIHEAFRGIRIVPTDGRPHPDDADPSFLGDSVGHWEGDTLVIDVRDFNDKTWLGFGAVHHTDKLQVTERFTRTGPESLSYEATITDPGVFTKPWTVRSAFALHPNERIREYECGENNLEAIKFQKLLEKLGSAKATAMIKRAAFALLVLAVLAVSARLAVAQAKPKIVTGIAAAKLFVYEGNPIHPFCLDFPLEGSSRNSTPNILAKCTDLKVAPKSEKDGWWSAAYPEEPGAFHLSFGPYNSYGVLAAKGGRFLIASESSGGGSGQFSALFWVRFDGKQVLDVKDEAGGDRCSGHLSGYRADGAAIRLDQSTSAADIIGLSEVKIAENVSGQLWSGYNDCAGEAHYRYDLSAEKLALTGLSLAGTEPAPDADPNNPRVCFDRLVQQYTKARKTDLKLAELKEFGQKFNAACGTLPQSRP